MVNVVVLSKCSIILVGMRLGPGIPGSRNQIQNPGLLIPEISPEILVSP